MAGILYVVGIGPGDAGQMTPQADAAIRDSRMLAGYTVYVDLVRERYPEKEVLTTAMTQEEKRCRMALACCAEGKIPPWFAAGMRACTGWPGWCWNWRRSIRM